MSTHALRAFKEALGTEKFQLTVGAGIVNSLLRVFDYIDQTTYANLTLWTVGAFIAGDAVTQLKRTGASNDLTRPA